MRPSFSISLVHLMSGWIELRSLWTATVLLCVNYNSQTSTLEERDAEFCSVKYLSIACILYKFFKWGCVDNEKRFIKMDAFSLIGAVK